MTKENYRDLLARYYRVPPDEIDENTLQQGYDAIQAAKPQMSRDSRRVLELRREQEGRAVVAHSEVLQKFGKDPKHAGWSSTKEIQALRHAVSELDKIKPKGRRTR